MRFRVLTAVKTCIVVFWTVTSCSLTYRLGGYQSFERTYRLHLQTYPKHMLSPEKLVTTHKTIRRHNPAGHSPQEQSKL
jgi:hypothetical protein